MAEWLRARGAQDLWIAGLAADYCVKFTALDAIEQGFRVHLVEDACRGVNLDPEDSARAVEEMAAAGVDVTSSAAAL